MRSLNKRKNDLDRHGLKSMVGVNRKIRAGRVVFCSILPFFGVSAKK